MQTLLLALALLPAATAIGIYVPEGCVETPGGSLVTKFELNDVCASVGPPIPLDPMFLFSEDCSDDTTFLLKCYDACVEADPINRVTARRRARNCWEVTKGSSRAPATRMSP